MTREIFSALPVRSSDSDQGTNIAAMRKIKSKECAALTLFELLLLAHSFRSRHSIVDAVTSTSRRQFY
jgi:hypothetical protein